MFKMNLNHIERATLIMQIQVFKYYKAWQGQPKSLSDGSLPHIAIDVFMSHNLLTLQH